MNGKMSFSTVRMKWDNPPLMYAPDFFCGGHELWIERVRFLCKLCPLRNRVWSSG